MHTVNFFTRFHLEADSIFALAFADKLTKKLNCHQETTGTQVFLCPKTVCPPHHNLNSYFPWLTSRAATANSSKKQYPTHFRQSTLTTSSSVLINSNSLNKKPANQSGRTYRPKMVAKLPLVSLWEGQIAVYGGKMSVWKNDQKHFQMSEQYWGCLDKVSEVNFSPAETLGLEDAWLGLYIFCIPMVIQNCLFSITERI